MSLLYLRLILKWIKCRSYIGVGLGLTGVGLGLTGVGLGLTGVGLGLTSVGLGLTGVGLGLTGVGLGLTGVGLGLTGVGLGLTGVGLGLTGPESRYYEHNNGPSVSIKRMEATVSSIDSVCAICICLLAFKVSRLGQMSSHTEVIIL
jgi:hypothetical protein